VEWTQEPFITAAIIGIAGTRVSPLRWESETQRKKQR
jgi:hypothetical protein